VIGAGFVEPDGGDLMNKGIAILIAAAGFGLSVLPANAQATRTWVSGVGSDANPCSRTAPCQTFAGAISKTTAGGEIDCLDPGGFGAVTITKSMTIDCGGVTGGILSSITNGVIVNAGVNDRIVLRNLNINGVGNGLTGVRFLAGLHLTLDNVRIQGTTGLGVDVNKVFPYLMEAAGSIRLDPAANFQRAFFSKLVPNTRKLGLLDANDGYLRRLWGDAGLLKYEFDDDTASDYEAYDAVASDRAAAAGAAAG